MAQEVTYLCCILVGVSAIMTVVSKNALHSVLFLVSCFFFSAMTVFLLENEFLALFFLIIYLGAIVVLFLFVVMMLDLKHNLLKLNRLHFPTGVLIGSISFFHFYNVLIVEHFGNAAQIRAYKNVPNSYSSWSFFSDQTTDVRVLADVFYHQYAAQLLIAGLLLYVSAVGVVFLTANKQKNSAKLTQSITRQLSRRNVL